MSPNPAAPPGGNAGQRRPAPLGAALLTVLVTSGVAPGLCGDVGKGFDPAPTGLRSPAPRSGAPSL